ncbi:MAG: FlgD immunoglobulin-like domain containing protein, partial [Spirochaetales bacterium]
DGTLDALTVPIAITDDRFVVEWAFAVTDESGAVVRTIENVDDRPENTGLQSFVDRVLSVSSGVPIPEQIRWDGRTNDGSIARDGTYRFELTAVDDNGNVGSSGSYTVVLDNTDPAIAIRPLSADERIFSPNDDGNKDSITIQQDGSVEEEWQAVIKAASGREVWRTTSTDTTPTDIVWDGRDNEGTLQPDGVYRYEITATDKAGNTARSSVANIIVDTEPTPVAVTISSGHFSPDDDGSQDTIVISPNIPVTTGLTEWVIAILDSAGNTVREFSEVSGNPRPVTFDGRGANRALLPEGSYSAEIRALYRNGNRPMATSAPFVLDITDPVATVTSDIDLFSPNGDRILDNVTFAQEASSEQSWAGSIIDGEGNTIRVFQWTDVPPTTISWNGRRDDGRLAADGVYRYVLSATDRAGNRGSSSPVFIELDTSGADLALQAVFAAFSPNADGVLDEQQFELQTDRPESVTDMTLRITNRAGETVWQTTTDRFRGSVTWRGTANDGTAVPDGEYSANVGITLANGTTNAAQTATFTLDRTPPAIDVTTAYTLFSPDGDGNRDELVIEQQSSVEEQWNASILSSGGAVVREYVFRGTAPDLRWSGTDEAGNQVPDGVYRYEISASDAAGNTVSRSVEGIRVDTRQPRLFVTAGSSGISPNGDGVRDRVDFELYANLLDGADGWRLTIRNSQNETIREFSGSDLRQQQTITWDGLNTAGEVTEGTMVAEYAVNYTKGNQPRAFSSEVTVDITPPAVSIDLSPLPFSPDNDGVNDALIIGLDVQDQSAIEAWRFEILDRNDRFFNEFTGRGKPASELVWDGKASDGELVISAEDYPYEFVIGDELGNVTQTRGFIPVDILVIRDGDRLRVQIANINFAPNSPSLVLDPESELGARNIAIIRRLGEVFDKYSTYNIRIEGHAVNVTGTDQEEREQLQPLSLQRADTVRQALIEQGISGRRITTLGRGGTEPVVPHTDLENRWKNRRVEFILIR